MDLALNNQQSQVMKAKWFKIMNILLIEIYLLLNNS